MALNKIIADSIADGTIVAAEIADGTITLAKLQSGLLPSATANSAATYANSAFTAANSAFLQANTPSYTANSAATYANSAFSKANTVNLTTQVTGTLPVGNGGTGAATLTANNVLLGNGTSAVQFVAPGTNGNILTSNGTTWTSAAPSGGVTSVNGQTGAVTTTSTNTIGSYFVGWGGSATAYSYGSTITGSSLTYLTDASYGGFSTLGNSGSDSSVAQTNHSGGSFTSAGLSGTWRCMTYGGLTPASGFRQLHLWVRVS